MKKSIKKSKKIIILSVVLLAFFCVNAFKSAYFAPAPIVSAEDDVLTWVTLDDIGINRVYRNSLNGFIFWTSFLETMTLNGTRSKTITENNINISLNNYYNHVSGTGGEYVTFTKNTELSISGGINTNTAIIITFYDVENSSKENIIQFMNTTYVKSFRFADVTINGVNFDEVFNESTNKYRLIAIQIFNVHTAGQVRQKTIQPYFYDFNDVDFNNQYNEIDAAWLLFANAAINNRRPTGSHFAFDSMIAQVSSVVYSENNSQYIFPVQQPTRWKTTNNEYRFLFDGAYSEDYILMPFVSENNTYNYAEKGVICNNGEIGTFNTDDLDTPEYFGENYYIKFETGNLAELYNGDYESLESNIALSNTISLISINAADSNIATGLIDSLFAQLQFTVYTPAPPTPPTPPTPETPDEIFEKAYNDYKGLVRDNTIKSRWWLPVSILTFGFFGAAIYAGIVQTVSLVDSGVAPALWNKTFNNPENVKNTAQKIVDFISQFLATIFSGIGTFFQEIIKAAANSPTAQKVLYVGLIVLGIAASGFLTVYFIKKRKE